MLLELELIERMDNETRAFLVSRRVQFALPNFGLNFLLSSREDPKRDFQEYFFGEVMPTAEDGTDTKQETRFLSGASLGGHSALVAFLRRPDLFRGVASTMGALLNFDFYSDKEFDRYVCEAGVSSDFANNLKQIFRGCFESYDLYRKIDPILLLRDMDSKLLREKRILVESGASDDFGFHAGMAGFSKALAEKGIQHRFDLVEGGRHEPGFVMSRFSPMLRFLLT